MDGWTGGRMGCGCVSRLREKFVLTDLLDILLFYLAQLLATITVILVRKETDPIVLLLWKSEVYSSLFGFVAGVIWLRVLRAEKCPTCAEPSLV